VVGRHPRLDVVELVFFVDVDEHACIESVEEAGAMDLARLEDDVSVAQDRRRPELLSVIDGIERAREEPVRKRIGDKEVRDREDAEVDRVRISVALQRAQIVGIPELLTQLLEELPVPATGLLPHIGVEMPTQVVCNAVVVEQRVVDIEEHDDVHLDLHASSTEGRTVNANSSSGVMSRSRRRPMSRFAPNELSAKPCLSNAARQVRTNSSETTG